MYYIIYLEYDNSYLSVYLYISLSIYLIISSKITWFSKSQQSSTFESNVWTRKKSLDLSAHSSLSCIDNLDWFESLRHEEERVERDDGDRGLAWGDETKEALIYPPNTRGPEHLGGIYRDYG